MSFTSKYRRYQIAAFKSSVFNLQVFCFCWHVKHQPWWLLLISCQSWAAWCVSGSGWRTKQRNPLFNGAQCESSDRPAKNKQHKASVVDTVIDLLHFSSFVYFQQGLQGVQGSHPAYSVLYKNPLKHLNYSQWLLASFVLCSNRGRQVG